MEEKIGQCSLCGGDVYAHTGGFFGNPPPPHCISCGAVAIRQGHVIPMAPRSDAPDGGLRESQQEYFGLKKK